MKENWFNHQYQQLHERLLRKKLNSASFKRHSANFEKSRSIGILFDATQPERIEHIRRFVQQLSNKGKEVTVLAFYNDKLLHDNCPYKNFSRKSLDWIMRPIGFEVERFMSQNFDVLINVSLQDAIPMQYIMALSNAKLRVGPATEKLYCYDLMIDTPDKQLPNYIKQVTFFLNKMNRANYEIPTA